MRLFIAILPDEAIRSELIRIQKEMKTNGVSGTYTDPYNLHITLAYIGEYPDTETVMEILETVDYEPFEITLEGIGAFKKIYWCGIRENAGLDSYVRRLRHALSDHQIPYDPKPFFPHVTLVRKADAPLPPVKPWPLQMRASRISLMRSQRTEKGMLYTELDAVE